MSRQLPDNIKRKRAVGIIPLEDDHCLLHAVATCIDNHKHPKQYKRTVVVKDQLSIYRYRYRWYRLDYVRHSQVEGNLGDTTIGYPTSVSQIAGFERRNSHLAIKLILRLINDQLIHSKSWELQTEKIPIS